MTPWRDFHIYLSEVLQLAAGCELESSMLFFGLVDGKLSSSIWGLASPQCGRALSTPAGFMMVAGLFSTKGLLRLPSLSSIVMIRLSSWSFSTREYVRELKSKLHISNKLAVSNVFDNNLAVG